MLNLQVDELSQSKHTLLLAPRSGKGLLLLLSRFSCIRLCATPDGSPPGSPVPGILQARTLEWVAISFPNRIGTTASY